MASSSTVSLSIAVALLVVVVLACSTGNVETPKTGRPVTARELIADYKANEVSADSTWKGRSLIVTGLVDSVGKDRNVYS